MRRNQYNADEIDVYGNQCQFSRQTDAQRGWQTMQAPPLGRWTRDWVHAGVMRKEVVNWAIDDAERNLKMWQDAPDEGFANMNLDLAYHKLGDILNWLYGSR